MADGTAAAPAAAPSTTAPSQGTAASGGEAKGTTLKHAQGSATTAPAAKTDAPSWSDDDKKAFFELAKRSPFKAKIKGEERAIDSEESLRELLNHAQRGIAGSKVAEERNKLQGELEQTKAERAREKQLFEAAKRGDWNARKELGLVSAEEIRQREADWEAVPEPVRQQHEELTKAQQELAELRAERAKAQQAEEARRMKVEAEQSRKVALEHTHSALEGLGINESNAERVVPFVEMAIRDLAEAGLEIGIDMTPDLIRERAKQMMGGFDGDMFSILDTGKKLELVRPDLEAIADEGQLLSTIGEKLALKIARAVARSQTQRRSSAAKQPPSPMQREVERKAPPMVLTPFRFGGGR
jgi:hypothetical protein